MPILGQNERPGRVVASIAVVAAAGALIALGLCAGFASASPLGRVSGSAHRITVGPHALAAVGALAPGDRAERTLELRYRGRFATVVLKTATKGSSLTIEAHALLTAAPIEFAGNCEGRDALGDEFRVIVADGFSGNVLLKGLEGAGRTLFQELREAAMSSTRAKLGGLLLKPALREVAERHDPDTYGGAYLLGVRGLSVIAHGSSGRRAIRNAILYAARGVQSGVVERMEGGLADAAEMTHLQDDALQHTVPVVVQPENGESQK